MDKTDPATSLPTITFLLGLCGSGKTWLKDRLAARVKFDEGFVNDSKQQADLFDALRAGKDAVVVEITYCEEKRRNKFLIDLYREVPGGLHVRWLCFEN